VVVAHQEKVAEVEFPGVGGQRVVLLALVPGLGVHVLDDARALHEELRHRIEAGDRGVLSEEVVQLLNPPRKQVGLIYDSTLPAWTPFKGFFCCEHDVPRTFLFQERHNIECLLAIFGGLDART
jgi:hypothetical protein